MSLAIITVLAPSIFSHKNAVVQVTNVPAEIKSSVLSQIDYLTRKNIVVMDHSQYEFFARDQSLANARSNFVFMRFGENLHSLVGKTAMGRNITSVIRMSKKHRVVIVGSALLCDRFLERPELTAMYILRLFVKQPRNQHSQHINYCDWEMRKSTAHEGFTLEMWTRKD